MNNKSFNIKYEVKFKDGSGLLGKEMIVKNCMSSLQAQFKLEKYLEKKYSNFDKLIVHECKEDTLGDLRNMFGGGDLFNSMFGGVK